MIEKHVEYLPVLRRPGWRVVAVKRTFNVRLGKMLQREPSDSKDELVPYLKANHVQWLGVETADLPEMWASPRDTREFGVARGDLLVCEGGEVGRAAIVGNVPARTIIQNALHRIRGTENGHVRFLKYVLESIALSDWFAVLCNRATIAHLTGDKLGALMIPLPPLPEQQQIADFLDRETAQIDSLIEKQRNLLEMLEENRLAITCRAVTRGINSNVEFKSSGVKWIGGVPDHWTVAAAKWISRIFVPQRNKPDLNTEADGIPWITMEQMGRPSVEEPTHWVSQEAASTAGSRVLKAGAVIGSCVGNFGVASINNDDVIINQQLQAFIPTQRITSDFLRLCVAIAKSYFEEVGTAATLTYVNQQGFGSLRLPLPPLEEQMAIVASVGEQTNKLNELDLKSKSLIERLLEYRSALISAAVTGQIDVRNYRPKEVAAGCP